MTNTTAMSELCGAVADEVQHRAGQRDVERAGRLVAQQHRGRHHRRPGQRHPLALTAGQLTPPAPSRCRAGSPTSAKRLSTAGPRLRPGQPFPRSRSRHQLADRQPRRQRRARVLEDHLRPLRRRRARWCRRRPGPGRRSTRSSVDLPDPLSPTSATDSPSMTDRSTPRSACSPLRLRTPSLQHERLACASEITAAAVCCGLGCAGPDRGRQARSAGSSASSVTATDGWSQASPPAEVRAGHRAGSASGRFEHGWQRRRSRRWRSRSTARTGTRGRVTGLGRLARQREQRAVAPGVQREPGAQQPMGVRVGRRVRERRRRSRPRPRRPPYSTAMRSAIWAATPRSWVTSTKLQPSRRESRSSSRIWACTVTSSAVVGSSAITSDGSPAIAMAIITRWRSPPDSSWG